MLQEQGSEPPAYIDHAFRTVYYGGQHEKFFEPFVQRWGKPNIETLSSVLVSGSPEERAIALFAIGYIIHRRQKKLYSLFSIVESRWSAGLAHYRLE